jgi:DNA-directed RNA polymerase specialized sigma24 family protein
METKLRTTRIPLFKIVKEALNNYTTWRRHIAICQQSHTHYDGTLCHTYIVYNEDRTPKEKVTVEMSFWDLLRGIEKISPRKREALWYGVILGKTQEEAGKIMGLRSVTVGQYSNAAAMELAKNITEIVEPL